MAQICKLCSRGPTKGASRSHSNIQSKRWIGINLQPRTLLGTRMQVCTRCSKTLAKLAKKRA